MDGVMEIGEGWCGVLDGSPHIRFLPGRHAPGHWVGVAESWTPAAVRVQQRRILLRGTWYGSDSYRSSAPRPDTGMSGPLLMPLPLPVPLALPLLQLLLRPPSPRPSLAAGQGKGKCTDAAAAGDVRHKCSRHRRGRCGGKGGRRWGHKTFRCQMTPGHSPRPRPMS